MITLPQNVLLVLGLLAAASANGLEGNLRGGDRTLEFKGTPEEYRLCKIAIKKCMTGCSGPECVHACDHMKVCKTDLPPKKPKKVTPTNDNMAACTKAKKSCMMDCMKVMKEENPKTDCRSKCASTLPECAKKANPKKTENEPKKTEHTPNNVKPPNANKLVHTPVKKAPNLHKVTNAPDEKLPNPKKTAHAPKKRPANPNKPETRGRHRQ